MWVVIVNGKPKICGSDLNCRVWILSEMSNEDDIYTEVKQYYDKSGNLEKEVQYTHNDNVYVLNRVEKI